MAITIKVKMNLQKLNDNLPLYFILQINASWILNFDLDLINNSFFC